MAAKKKKTRRRRQNVVVIRNPKVAKEVKGVLRRMGIRFGSRQVKNVRGFQDAAGRFHPIRGSEGYDEDEVGERVTYRRKAKKKAKRRR